MPLPRCKEWGNAKHNNYAEYPFQQHYDYFFNRIGYGCCKHILVESPYYACKNISYCMERNSMDNEKMTTKNTPQAIIIHHEAAANGLLAVNEYHKKRWNFRSSLGWFVGYGYYIDFQGNITQTRAENEEQAHCLGGWNTKSVGICLMGHLGLQGPTEAQIKALEGLVEAIQQRWGIPDNKIYGHGELWPTECPGEHGMKVLEKLRETTPDLIAMQKQIAIITEIINQLRIAFEKFFAKKVGK